MAKRQTSPKTTYRFGCTQCGACCRRPGYVELQASDIERLMQHLGLSDIEFFETYGVVAFGENFAIHVDEGISCVFLDGDICSVFEARPAQCRTYPFWPEIVESKETWDAEALFCPGIGVGVEYSEKEVQGLVTGEGATRAEKNRS